MNQKHFRDEKSAIKYVESIICRDGKKCPHCQNCNQDKIYEIKSEKARLGTHKCGSCKKQFTVKIGTVFEASHIPLYKWLQAKKVYLLINYTELLKLLISLLRF